MTCITVFGLHTNYVDISENAISKKKNTNYSHLGGKANHIFNSLISLTGIFTKNV